MSDIINTILEQSNFIDKMSYTRKKLTVGYSVYIDIMQEYSHPVNTEGEFVLFLGMPIDVDYNNPEIISVRGIE